MTRTLDQPDRALHGPLRWFVRLRWGAGAATLAGSLAMAVSGLPARRAIEVATVGAVILAYNLVLWRLLRGGRRSGRPGRPLVALAEVQIALDLVCLSALVSWTGGLGSPLTGFFVFHMVFASLLLSRPLAYAAALLALLTMTASLWMTGGLPQTPGGQMALLGWALTLVGTVFVANPITQRLRRHRARLAAQNQRVRQMSRQLRQQQKALIQHEKMAAMGQMAAGIAHEIANPLANLDSVLQLMRRRPERQTPERLATLNEQVERISQIIQSMTDFAHPTQTEWQSMQLDEVVELGLRMIRFDRRQKRVRIERDLSPGCCRVRVQPHAMQQVLINVLLNAMDAVHEVPDPRIVVRSHCTHETCRIDVIDNGPGIPAEHRERLFEPFFTTKPVGKGTGLGLAISYSLMQNQGGQIRVEPADGGGTAVQIVLLRDTEAATAEGSACEVRHD